MENKNRDVVFRRIRGRIVPIRRKKTSPGVSDTAKGVTAITAGLGIAAGGGELYRRAVLKTSNLALSALTKMDPIKTKPGGQMGFDDLSRVKQHKENIHKLFRSSRRLLGFSKAIRKVSPAVGAGLLTFGAVKLMNSGKKKKKIDAGFAAGGAVVTAAVAPKAVEVAKGAFEAGMHGRQQTFKFVGRSAFDILRKIAD